MNLDKDLIEKIWQFEESIEGRFSGEGGSTTAYVPQSMQEILEQCLDHKSVKSPAQKDYLEAQLIKIFARFDRPVFFEELERCKNYFRWGLEKSFLPPKVSEAEYQKLLEHLRYLDEVQKVKNLLPKQASWSWLVRLSSDHWGIIDRLELLLPWNKKKAIAAIDILENEIPRYARWKLGADKIKRAKDRVGQY